MEWGLAAVRGNRKGVGHRKMGRDGGLTAGKQRGREIGLATGKQKGRRDGWPLADERELGLAIGKMGWRVSRIERDRSFRVKVIESSS